MSSLSLPSLDTIFNNFEYGFHVDDVPVDALEAAREYDLELGSDETSNTECVENTLDDTPTENDNHNLNYTEESTEESSEYESENEDDDMADVSFAVKAMHRKKKAVKLSKKSKSYKMANNNPSKMKENVSKFHGLYCYVCLQEII